jgi:intein/homing endonuclease
LSYGGIPDITPELAEVIGLNIGDGCVHRRVSSTSWSYQVAFTASPKEYWYYEEFVKPTIDSAFSVNGRLYLRSDNTTRLHVGSKRFVDYMVWLGLPVGKKHDVSIPDLPLRKGLVVPFIRGIYHAEGSIYRRYSKRYNTHTKVYDNLLVIQIRMKLKTLMMQLSEEIVKLGIVPNRLIENDGVYTLRITSQSEIRRFLEVIQPRYKLLPLR